MNLQFASAAPCVYTVNGQEITFPRLTIADWTLIGSKLHARQRTEQGENIKLLREGGVTPAQMPALVRELSKPPTYVEVYNYILTPEGAKEVLAISLKKNGSEIKPEELDKLTEIEKLVSIAADVACMNDIRWEKAGGALPLAVSPTTSEKATG